MRRSNSCSTPITVRNPDVAQLAPGFNLVNISKAWQYSTGNGVPVAVIDTGVSLNPRLPVVPGGDYIMGAYQVINRIVQSAHNPPAGVDNKLGYGLVDPVAALTFNIPSGDRMAPGAQSRVITPAAPPPPPDHRARNIAIGFVGAVATGVLAMAIGARLRRAR